MQSGIVANTYRDPDSGKMIYCLNDPSVVIAGDPKQKTLNVRITVAGIVPKSLAPQKKGA